MGNGTYQLSVSIQGCTDTQAAQLLSLINSAVVNAGKTLVVSSSIFTETI